MDSLAVFQQKQARAQALSAQVAAKQTAAAAAAAAKQPPEGGAKGASSRDGSVPAPSAPLDPSNWMQNQEYYMARREAQKLPVGMKIKKVIEVLEKERRLMSLQEIEDATLIDATKDTALQEGMKNNPKIAVEGDKFRYKAKHELKGKDDLLRMIRAYKDGIPLSDVLDAYPEVRQHVEELKNVSQIWVLSSSENPEDTVLYPNDPKMVMRVDADVAALFRGIDLPHDIIDIEKELKKSGQAPCTTAIRDQHKHANPQHRVQQKQKSGKRRRDIKRSRFTNAHLSDLFQEAGGNG